MPDCLTGRSKPFLYGYKDRRTICQWKLLQNCTGAKSSLTHEGGPFIILERTGDYFSRRSCSLVNQSYNRQVGNYAARYDLDMRDFSLAILCKYYVTGLEIATCDSNSFLQEAAGIIAKVQYNSGRFFAFIDVSAALS